MNRLMFSEVDVLLLLQIVITKDEHKNTLEFWSKEQSTSIVRHCPEENLKIHPVFSCSIPTRNE